MIGKREKSLYFSSTSPKKAATVGEKGAAGGLSAEELEKLLALLGQKKAAALQSDRTWLAAERA
jgi:hypothetical protein